MKELLAYIAFVAFVPLVWYWVTGGEVNWNLLEVWRKANDSMNHQMDLGGWHRAGMIFIIVSPIIIVVLILIIRDMINQKKKKED